MMHGSERVYIVVRSVKSFTLSKYIWVVDFISLEQTFSLKVSFVKEQSSINFIKIMYDLAFLVNMIRNK